MPVAGVNGFGRFGAHLLKYWLDRSQDSGFKIEYINDDSLDIDQILDLIDSDTKLQISKTYKIHKDGNVLSFLSPSGVNHSIKVTNEAHEDISWIGKPDLFLECSGKNTNADDSLKFYKGNTQRVVVSATSWNADQTLVYGFNHETINPESKVISYGSCTVNAYVPLASYLHKKYRLVNSDVNVIHNLQEYKLADKSNHTLLRKFCTLEKSGPNLLSFVRNDNFKVNYTVIPYSLLSTIDFRFQFQQNISEDAFLEDLRHAISDGELKNLYGMDKTDRGPEVHVCTPYSSVFIEESIKKVGDSFYVFSYFDNENSVNRYFDLIKYLSQMN